MEVIDKFSMTIEELAQKHGKGQQAIRNYIDRYKELQGHFKRENGSTHLDEFAVAFIEAKLKPRKPDNIILNQELVEKINMLQDKLIQAQEKNLSLLEENQRLQLSVAEQRKLLESSENLKEVIEDLEQQLSIESDASDLLRQDYNQIQEQLQIEKEEKAKAFRLKDRFEAELEKAAELNEALQLQSEEQAEEIERLKSRTLWQRIRNR